MHDGGGGDGGGAGGGHHGGFDSSHHHQIDANGIPILSGTTRGRRRSRRGPLAFQLVVLLVFAGIAIFILLH